MTVVSGGAGAWARTVNSANSRDDVDDTCTSQACPAELSQIAGVTE